MRIAFILIGDSTLVIRCADHLIARGHAIAAIASRNRQIAGWCAENGTTFIDRDAGPLDQALGALTCDILLSVANLEVLPAAVLRAARRIALNFHDGPLPDLGGLNAPVWALLEGRRTHAVTWHEMTPSVDAGRIAEIEPIVIAADETTFSLNAKCYEAGLTTFERLLAGLEGGTLNLREQIGTPRLLRRSDRPASFGLIDPGQAAAAIVRLVHALDHGPYWNPVTAAKLLVAGEVVLVRSAEALAGAAPTAPAGTILARERDAIVIATGDGAARLDGLSYADGRPVDVTAASTLLPGASVSAPKTLPRERLEAAGRAAARSEYASLRQWAAVPNVDLPYPTRVAPTSSEAASLARIEVPLEIDVARVAGGIDSSKTAALLAGLATWIARLSGTPSVLVALETPATRDAIAGVEPLFRSDRFLAVDAVGASTCREIATGIEALVAATEAAGPIARDLEARLRLTDAPLAGLPRPLIGLVVGDQSDRASPRAAAVTLVLDPRTDRVVLDVDAAMFTPATADVMASHLAHLLDAMAWASTSRIDALPLVPQTEHDVFEAINATQVFAPVGLVAIAFNARAASTPDRVALRWHTRTITYGSLKSQVDRLAGVLRSHGSGPGSLVAVSMDRTPAMVIALLAILTTGAAYVPVDPRFPAERSAFILEDSGARLLVTDDQSKAAQAGAIVLDVMGEALSAPPVVDAMANSTPPSRAPSDLAYLAYTSGSTGKPKGVCVTNANVTAFLAAMDARIPGPRDGVWLAVTSISFDISVLELFWTLTRGFTVALHSEVPEPANDSASRDVGPSLSLFYFAAAPPESQATAKAPDTYRLLMEGARFADAHGFEAVWTPERHFHAFGGIYPNPAVTGAAVAAVTKRIAIRAGSIVLPLHDPIRVAEDWSVIDNLSGGRVGIAVASGWMPEDFVLAPHAFERRKQVMLEHIDTIARLWRGEKVARPKPDGTMAEIGTLPRPVQPALPVWLTAAKNPETFEIAGTRGANVLTHLLGMSVEEMAENIATYRRAWAKAGHAGTGRVTLMLHTFVGPDDASVRNAVREPMKRYLASAVDIVRAAEWNFPTLVGKGEGGLAASKKRLTAADLGPEDLDAVLEHAFDRYYGSSGLFGTPDRCAEFARRLKALGVDELACLVDFGVDTDAVLASLPQLAEVGTKLGAARPPEPVSVAADIVRHGATHFQCTPSMAAMLLADDDGRNALGSLRAMLVGGEALPPDMAEALVGTVSGPVLNMYGPTETTVWSTAAELAPAMPFVPLGTPLAGESIDIVGAAGQPLPALVAGELVIGGLGVADGYWRRPELTAERFVMRTTEAGTSRWYRTGDLARRHPSGALEYLGRIDQQVKIRGHRIELGEIEATLASSPEIAQVAVVARQSTGGTPELAAFVVPAPGAAPTAATLLGEVARRLPQIMVPASLTILDRLPQTANGKIDRTALAKRTTTPARPAVVSPTAGDDGRPAPLAAATPGSTDESEQRIAHVWARLLGRADIAHTDNFFDLGGHSLLAVELHRTLVSELSLDLKLTDIFRYPTVVALARHASRAAPPEKVASVAGQDRARMRLEMTRRARTRSGTGPASPGGADG